MILNVTDRFNRTDMPLKGYVILSICMVGLAWLVSF